MGLDILERKFARIGARLKLNASQRGLRTQRGLVSLDVQRDARGEFFDIEVQRHSATEIEVLDLQPADRHLLVLVRENGQKAKFLCGHDERHWFVAAIPESAPVGTVRQAKEALKPPEVQQLQAQGGLRGTARNRRKNAAFVRQGEWFFLPAPTLQVDAKRMLTHERLVRGNGGKPHWAEYCFRSGGLTVRVCDRHPNGLTEEEYQRLAQRNPEIWKWHWITMTRNAAVFVRGRISHADHRTIVLQGWHKVLMNTENQSRAMRNVAFLD